jgi:hypothetical protein
MLRGPCIEGVDAGLGKPAEARFAAFSGATFKLWYAREAESVGYMSRRGKGILKAQEIRSLYSPTGTCSWGGKGRDTTPRGDILYVDVSTQLLKSLCSGVV